MWFISKIINLVQPGRDKEQSTHKTLERVWKWTKDTEEIL